MQSVKKIIDYDSETPPSLWEKAVKSVRNRSPGSFDQWFSGIQYDGMVDGILSLRARDEFVRSWVEDHFIPSLADYIREHTGWSVQLTWTIDHNLERPVASIPATPPPLRTGPVPLKPTAANGNSTPHHQMEPAQPPNVTSKDCVSPSDKTSSTFAERINKKYTFANFVVGPSNQLAHAAAIGAAGGGGTRHNPLFICGGTGLGKTHLVHAVAHRIQQEHPSARIVYVSAERFVNEFVQALADHKMNEFRSRYRVQCDVLLVDDIQFLASKTQTQEEFFHAFNALHQFGKQIIVTSDKYPQQLERMEERLISRFTWGLVADIQPPELETRVAILKKKAAFEGIPLDDEVALYIAQAVRSNIRELEGALIRLIAKSSLIHQPLDLAFACSEMAATRGDRNSDTRIEDIQRFVCHRFKLRSTDLTGKQRHKTIALARHIAMYLCKISIKSSLPEIGRAFGNRDHTTVLNGIRKIEALREANLEVRAHVEFLEKKLGLND
ncbi:chromosomal replication initiator protein DnaA [Pajaroellobacter abortibovis]|uniref:Chromosomal replication initiator protein DnaA n=1 Tax=Pajaroellobacter abortibovis TaxID=1882918 RepID=A0A1L6MZL5_9BACT|nr:chromosomal replication initiator protein DnaA [Pajaroellobacter abortibovis]APS00959.1 chromosomal replication initiator protein DnaA [Pajaroellobacter abortibovis]